MSITKCPGHMRSLKLNFSATVLTLGLKAKIFENLRLCKAKFWGELRTRATCDRCEHRAHTAVKRLSMREKLQEQRTAFCPRQVSNFSRQRFIDPPELLFSTLFPCLRSRFLYTSSSGGHAQ